jgi:hypothetical protein
MPGTATPTVYFRHDQLVTTPTKPGRVYRVVDTPGGRRKTYLIEDVETGERLKGPGAALVAHEGEAPVQELLPPLVVGAAVLVTGNAKIPADLPHVVLGSTGIGDVKVVRLGGDGNRYWTVPRRAVAEIALERLGELLATS